MNPSISNQNPTLANPTFDRMSAVDISRTLAQDVIAKKKVEGVGVSKFMDENIDASRLSEESVDELQGKGAGNEGDVRGIIKNLIESKINNAIDGAKKVKRDGKDEEKPQIEVDWTPLVQNGQKVEVGQPWGNFRISRNKPDGDNKKQQVAENEKNAIVETPDGKDPKALKETRLQKLEIKGGENADKGKGAGGSMSWSIGEDGKVFITDTGTGSRIEVPENGSIKAERPMQIKQVGNGGKLKGGETLFTYQLLGDENQKDAYNEKRKLETDEKQQIGASEEKRAGVQD